MFRPSPRVTSAAPDRRSPCPSDPGLPGVAAPLVLKRFKGRETGGVKISTGDSAVRGLHRGPGPSGYPLYGLPREHRAPGLAARSLGPLGH